MNPPEETTPKRYRMSAYRHNDGRLLVDAIQNEEGGWMMRKDHENIVDSIRTQLEEARETLDAEIESQIFSILSCVAYDMREAVEKDLRALLSHLTARRVPETHVSNQLDSLRAHLEERTSHVIVSQSAQALACSEPVHAAYKALEAENEALRKIIDLVYRIATGEDQVADDDTGGMEYIANYIKQSTTPTARIHRIRQSDMSEARRRKPPNKNGCKPVEDVCVMHDRPLECRHGCSEAKKHTCKELAERHQEDFKGK